MDGAENSIARTQRLRQSGATKARIGDVARAAGVSTATVSRALTAPGMVQAERRERVLEAVRALRYTPNVAARRLRTGASMTILVVVPRRRNPPFFSEVLRGVDVELANAGYTALLANLDSLTGNEGRLLDLVYGGQLDGAIVLNGALPLEDDRSILAAGIPVVGICAPAADVAAPAVVIDDMNCAMAQTRYLIELGHRRLLYISGPIGYYNEVHRYRGFQAAAQAAGLSDGDLFRFEGNYEFSSGVAAGAAFVDMARRPTGVVATSDEMAIAFMSTVRRAGLTVPGEVSVIGFDGIEFGDFVEPALTTIRQPRFELGSTGTRLLLNLIRGDAPAPALTVLPGQLILRASAGAPMS
jgi:LacI family transcriptional regulator, repressor for deo operon, udp, cdd, tsx, nupC, and nupG